MGSYASAMRFHQMADDGEAEAQSACFTRCAVVGLTEALENVWKKLGRDTYPGIADGDLRSVPMVAGEAHGEFFA